MARDLWKGSISFGLVEIPVSLVGSENAEEKVKLSYLDRRDFAPVGYRRFNKKTDAEVPWEEIVHGYEYEKGEYVVLTKQDLQRANPELTRTIEIMHFADAADIDPMFLETAYYVEPAKPKSKGYVLLRETLRRTKKVGIAKVALRTREHIAMLGVRGNALVLQLLRFGSEVRAPAEVENTAISLADVGVQPKEIAMAERLVADMSAPWDPERYVDEYAQDLMKLIEKRIASGEVHALDERAPKAPARRRGEILDLMPLLEQSLAAAREGRDGRGGGAAPRKPRGRRKKSA